MMLTSAQPGTIAAVSAASACVFAAPSGVARYVRYARACDDASGSSSKYFVFSVSGANGSARSVVICRAITSSTRSSHAVMRRARASDASAPIGWYASPSFAA